MSYFKKERFFLGFFLISIALFSVIFFHSHPAFAEIATVRDWIGFFAVDQAGNTKTDTLGGNLWKYTSNCIQPTPLASDKPQLAGGCSFTMPSTFQPGAYEFRLNANDTDTLIGQSKVIWSPINMQTPIPDCSGQTITLQWPVLKGVSTIDIFRDGYAYNLGLSGTSISFTDSTISATQTYSYKIKANSIRSGFSRFSENSYSVSACVGATPTPPAGTSTCPTGDNAIRLENGLLTLVNESILNRFSIKNSTPSSAYCITGNPASIPAIYTRTYNDVKSIFFDQSTSTLFLKTTLPAGNQTQAAIDLNTPTSTISGKLYSVTGDFSVGGNIPVTKTGVIFVSGNLLINPSGNQLTHTAESAGLVFVVKGNVNIAQNVTRIDAFIITEGQFCSAWDTSSSSCASSYVTTPLAINGSIISLSSDTTKKPLFKRSTTDNANPGETITYKPKYLPILKDVFAKDQNIWSEIK